MSFRDNRRRVRFASTATALITVAVALTPNTSVVEAIARNQPPAEPPVRRSGFGGVVAWVQNAFGGGRRERRAMDARDHLLRAVDTSLGRLAMRSAFRVVDADNTGALEHIEVTRGLHESGLPRLQSGLVDYVMKQADADLDGRISLDEFLYPPYQLQRHLLDLAIEDGTVLQRFVPGFVLRHFMPKGGENALQQSRQRPPSHTASTAF